MPRPVSKTFPEFKGDLAEKSDTEMKMAFPNPIKGIGSDLAVRAILKFRREKMVSDKTDGYDTSLSCREVPTDQVVG